jgi:hypothetical protein
MMLAEYYWMLDEQLRKLKQGIILEDDQIKKEKLKDYFMALFSEKLIISELRSKFQAPNFDLFEEAKIYDDVSSPSKKVLFPLMIDSQTFENKLADYLRKMDKNGKFKTVILEMFHDEIKQYALEKTGSFLLSFIKKQIKKEIFKKLAPRILARAAIDITQGVIIGAVIDSFKSEGKMPQDEWIEIISESQEMILNPDWAVKLGMVNPPWYAHAWALWKRRSEVEFNFETLLTASRNEFQLKIREIYDPNNSHAYNCTASRDGLCINDNRLERDYLPDWAK